MIDCWWGITNNKLLIIAILFMLVAIKKSVNNSNASNYVSYY